VATRSPSSRMTGYAPVPTSTNPLPGRPNRSAALREGRGRGVPGVRPRTPNRSTS
jgi:hypothetical protein